MATIFQPAAEEVPSSANDEDLLSKTEELLSQHCDDSDSSFESHDECTSEGLSTGVDEPSDHLIDTEPSMSSGISDTDDNTNTGDTDVAGNTNISRDISVQVNT